MKAARGSAIKGTPPVQSPSRQSTGRTAVGSRRTTEAHSVARQEAGALEEQLSARLDERMLEPAGLTGGWQIAARTHSGFGEALDMGVERTNGYRARGPEPEGEVIR